VRPSYFLLALTTWSSLVVATPQPLLILIPVSQLNW
jgi:hypothetical protein